LKKKFKDYEGPINRETMEGEVKRAYTSYCMQRQRCYNPKNNRFKYYGARGIEVEYEAREFIGWWLWQRSLNPDMKHPQCGRIDHGGNYRFDNIEVVSRADNLREMNTRKGPPVKVVAETRDGIRLHFDSIGECARIVGINRELLEQHLAGKNESPVPQLVFRYY
jgi:hypothetical protein